MSFHERPQATRDERELIPAADVYKRLELLSEVAGTIEQLPLDHPFREAYQEQTDVMYQADNEIHSIDETFEELLIELGAVEEVQKSRWRYLRHRPSTIGKRIVSIMERIGQIDQERKLAPLKFIQSNIKMYVAFRMSHSILRSRVMPEIVEDARVALEKLIEEGMLNGIINDSYSTTKDYQEIQDFITELAQRAEEHGSLS
ncbi:MAG: hypothetical protein WA843_02685 [Candidatus Saccharimonadales bacterium]